MELDWSTFLLEIVNFLILVWILKRFLYRPVLDAVASRKRKVEETLSAAEKMRMEAQDVKMENERLLREWEDGKQALETALSSEIGEKRKKLLDSLQADLSKEKEKRIAQDARQAKEWRREAENGALDAASKFASRLLSRFAAPELESKICDAFLEDLAKLEAGPIREMLASQTDLVLAVSSAHPLSEDRKNEIVSAVSMLAGRKLQGIFIEDSEILCGIRARVGPWVMDANLADELAFFREAARNGS